MGITYKKAKFDESRRQDFLNNFFKRNPNKSVRHLIYNLKKQKGLERLGELQRQCYIDSTEIENLVKVTYNSPHYAFLIITPGMIGRGNKHPIFVNPRSFDELNEEDFEYNLVDHEYKHAQYFREGIYLAKNIIIDHTNAIQLQPETLEAILDSLALVNQLIRGKEKSIQDSKAFSNAIHGFLKYCHILKNIQPINDFENEVIHTQIKSYQRILPLHLREK